MAEYKKIRGNLEAVIDEKTAFENEKNLLQRSAVLAEQRASGLQELWRSCKADLAAARLSAAQAHALLNTEKTRVRQAKDENTELLEKITEKDEQIAKLSEEVKGLNDLVNQLKKDVSMKDENIQTIEKEKTALLLEINQKDEELKKKNVELHHEMLKTEELNDKVELLAAQIQKLQEKLDQWPFNFSNNWTLSSHISSLCYNITMNVYHKVLNVASIFHFQK